ncbi:DUF11 domain-containing protein [Tessaracoccus defluvii]|uniref:DUF11 domain-containing protein n=1 Tax=Tessaracoccus defluvii TaxID=1285901 RepID=A0A7H0H360_9ACTN|nr:DUF11 domain-containing protein [Tessaracoccus defluvii]QNP54976.1 DUF11 domain-containing protein [Tessaracoccus defluvii]
MAAVPASAADIPLAGGGTLQTRFEIDGNMDGANDWNGIFATPYGPNGTSTGILDVVDGSEPCNGSNDDVFVSGTKLDNATWPLVTGGANKKSDLCRSGAAYEIVRVNGQQHIILYQYWTRNPEGTGDLTVYQVLEGPQPGRADDYLIEFDYDSKGAGGVAIDALGWNGSKWVSTPGSVIYQAKAGQVTATDKVGTFGEMAIDLTASGLLPEDGCVVTATGPVMTRTGESQSASLVDHFAGEPMQLTSCTSLSVTKVVEGAVPAGQQFDYSIVQVDGKPVHDDKLTGTVQDTDISTSSITAKIGAGDTHTWNNVIAQPDYLVSEDTSTLPAGVTLDTIECTYTDLYQVGRPRVTTTIYENDEYTGHEFALFPSSTGIDPAACTITNVATSLTLNKNLVNDHGGTATLNDFTLTATPVGGGAAVINGPDPSASADEGVTALVAPGSFTLSETENDGYAQGTWSCTPASALNGNVVTVAARESVSCVITNDDKPAKLTLVKDVTNQWGGTAVGTDFTLTATGPVTISGAEGAVTVTAAEVPIGDYVIGETAMAGYELESVTCTGATFNSDTDTVTLTPGGEATCTVSNVDLPGSLKLIKEVSNDNGGTLEPTEWTLTATGPTTGITGTTPVEAAKVIAGDYALSETGPAGYEGLAWECTGGTLTESTVSVANGADVVCTIVNDDIAPKLTLIKTVVNDNGGQNPATAWTLNASGPSSVTGATGSDAVTGVSVDAGSYTLSESGPAGYSASAWSCTGASLTGSQVTLAPGDVAVCSITNDDIAPKLTLVKTVTNDNGGQALPGDFTLTATGPTPITGVTGATAVTGATVNAGQYALSETNLDGYAAGAWSCEGGGILDGSTLGLLPGEDVTCTINNDDIAASLTLVKEVVNDDGGTAVPTDWTLSADGPTPISGVNGEAVITAAGVAAGSYDLSESGLDGYAASAWTCTGGTLTGSTVAVTNGAEVVCTIVNDDIAPKLTLVKEVTNDDGGTLTPADFPLTATGPSTITGVTGEVAVTGADVSAGEYTLSEAGVAGYAAGDWSCTTESLDGETLTLFPGEEVTCTIVNDDIAPKLTLVKEVTNDDGGTLTPAHFPLTATGPSTITGVTGEVAVTGAVVKAGEYTLSEAGVAGYAAGDWSCTTESFDGETLTLFPGEEVTCTIVNDDIAPKLTLVKEVVNDDGGNAGVADFVLTAEGADTITGLTGEVAVTGAVVKAGEYTLSEAGVAGYAAGDWTCTTESFDGETLTLFPGEEVTCTIVNDDLPVDLSIFKDDGDVSVKPGEQFDYTITVYNVGERDVDADEPVIVTDLLPEYLHFVSGPETCTAVGSTVTCTVDPADLPSGGEHMIVLTVEVDLAADPGVYVNKAVVETEDDPAPENPECPTVVQRSAQPENNVDCEETPVVGDPGLEIVKAVYEASEETWVPSDGKAEFGDSIRYRLSITATGDLTEKGVVVTDVLDSQLRYAAADCATHLPCDVTFDPATRKVSVNVGDLAPGATVDVWLTVTLPPAPPQAAGTTVTAVVPNVAMAASKASPEAPSNKVITELKRTTPPVPPKPTPPKPGLPSTGADGAAA